MDRFTDYKDGWRVLGDGAYMDDTLSIRGEAIDRLAAYEDTGTEPEEIGDVVMHCEDLGLGGLLGLLNAIATDRLIVLPENWKDLCGRTGMQLYTIYEGDVYDAAVTDVYIDENGEGRFAYAVFPDEDPFDTEWFDEPVSRFWDVLFRTCEEAEAALEEKP